MFAVDTLRMSDLGGSEGREEGEEQVDYVAPIAALPPKVILQEESQMEVSASPAFLEAVAPYRATTTHLPDIIPPSER